ncbi:MAG: hypothetical protein L5655_08300 [Thermosediminibacteraceae bacterium]|nr:hypothetical protein [Thermosediminibacteraceae bacterium]
MLFSRDYSFRGKHALYVEKLKEKLFSRDIDVYIIAPVLGVYYKRTASVDNTDDKTEKILTEQLVRERRKLEFAYKLVLLCDEKYTKYENLEERIKRVFSNKEEIIKENMKIFNEYVLGGVEILYEKIIEENEEDSIEGFKKFANDFIDEAKKNQTLEKDLQEIFEHLESENYSSD